MVKLTKEEQEILAMAKKIETEAMDKVASSETQETDQKISVNEKNLGSAGSVILANPCIANFSGRSFLDNTGEITIDTTNEMEILKAQIKELQRIIKGGE